MSGAHTSLLTPASVPSYVPPYCTNDNIFLPYRIERPRPPTFTFYPIPIQRPPKIHSPTPRRAYATAEILSPEYNLEPYIRSMMTITTTTTITTQYEISISPLSSPGKFNHQTASDSGGVDSEYAPPEEDREAPEVYSTPPTSPTPSQLESNLAPEIPEGLTWDDLFEDLWRRFSISQHTKCAESEGGTHARRKKGTKKRSKPKQTGNTTGM